MQVVEVVALKVRWTKALFKLVTTWCLSPGFTVIISYFPIIFLDGENCYLTTIDPCAGTSQ